MSKKRGETHSIRSLLLLFVGVRILIERVYDLESCRAVKRMSTCTKGELGRIKRLLFVNIVIASLGVIAVVNGMRFIVGCEMS